jgi:hypothetical protein
MAKDKVAKYMWKPSKIQQELLRWAIEVGTDEFKPTVWLESRKKSPSNWTKWKKDDRFVDWFFLAWERGMKWKVVDLDRIGMEKASEDYRYWEAMQKKYGGMVDDKGGAGKLTFNFNIPRPQELPEPKEVIDVE